MSKLQFRNIDLNLLIPLKALLHERNVTRAAKRIHLSQSAMSRALDRLRTELGDELLVRVGRNYELTPRGTALLNELGQIMPRLVLLWEGEPFSPAQSEAKVRLAMTEDASSVVLPQLVECLARLAPGITLEVVPWHERTHEDNLATQLIITAFTPPATFRFQSLFEDTFVCVAGRKLKRGKGAISMQEYLTFRHLSIEAQPHQQNLIDRSLAEAGLRRHIAIHLPYFQAAIRVLEATDLVLTSPARMAEPTLAALTFQQLRVPKEFPRIRYSMVWHPRFDSDQLHIWIRETVQRLFRLPGPRQE